MIQLLAVIIVVGILLWLAHQFLAPIMDALIYRILVAVVVLCLVLYILTAFGLLPLNVGVPKVTK